jgi:hypothetical protein
MAQAATWYRTKLDRELLRTLTKKSDARGLVQALGVLLVWKFRNFKASVKVAVKVVLGSLGVVGRIGAPETEGSVVVQAMVTAAQRCRGRRLDQRAPNSWPDGAYWA